MPIMHVKSLIKSRKKKFLRPVKDRNIQQQLENSYNNNSVEKLVVAHFYSVAIYPVAKDLVEGHITYTVLIVR